MARPRPRSLAVAVAAVVVVVAVALAGGPAGATAVHGEANGGGLSASGQAGSLQQAAGGALDPIDGETNGTSFTNDSVTDGDPLPGNDSPTGNDSVTDGDPLSENGSLTNDSTVNGSLSGDTTTNGSPTNDSIVNDSPTNDSIVNDSPTNDSLPADSPADGDPTNDSPSGDDTVVSNDTSTIVDDPTNGSPTTDLANASPTIDVDVDDGISLRAGTETVLDASLEAAVDDTGVSLSLDAESIAGLGLSTNATFHADVGSGDSDGSTGGERDGSSGEGPAATGGDDTDTGDGDRAGGGGGSDSGGLPDPEDAGAGLAVGSVLVGGGLLARRFAETSLLAGGSGSGAGAGGGSILSAALAWLRAWGWRFLALFGYQRLDSSDPLEHDTRAGIYERIDDAPGVFLTELSEQTDVPMSTLRYHLRILAYEDLITSEKVRGKRRYSPREADRDALDPALEDDATAAVLEAVAREPDSVSGLADRLDRDPSTVTHHLQRLDDEGLVEREREGRSVVTRLADGIDRTDVAAATAGHAD